MKCHNPTINFMYKKQVTSHPNGSYQMSYMATRLPTTTIYLV